jgi:hypothetical protein
MSLLLLLSISPFYLDKCQVEMQRRVCIYPLASARLGNVILFLLVFPIVVMTWNNQRSSLV